MSCLQQGILFIAAIIGVARTACAAAPPTYQLMWQDEFKDSSLDVRKWKAAANKRDAAQLTGEAISLGKEGLRIHTYSKGGTHYTGFLTTAGRFSATYGYFESRIRFHDVPGEHCAFWLQSPTLGKMIGAPQQSGVETDIIEHRATDAKGKDIRNLASFNLHWDGYGVEHKHVGSQWLAPSSLDGTWHTYAVLWTPVEYVFYVDDVERWRTNAAVSHAPQEIRLTCEIKYHAWSGEIPDGGYGSRPTSPYGMDVNWVRVWQKSK